MPNYYPCCSTGWVQIVPSARDAGRSVIARGNTTRPSVLVPYGCSRISTGSKNPRLNCFFSVKMHECQFERKKLIYFCS